LWANSVPSAWPRRFASQAPPDDGLAEEAREPGATRCAQIDQPPADLAADRYVVLIAAEGCDVPFDPCRERGLLVLENEIAAASQRRKREKAERAEPVVERDPRLLQANDPVLPSLLPLPVT
jgi:hypothetical protein